MALFSVIIPLYNKEQTIERAVRSVLNQTVQDFEIIIVNDGSTDGGPQVVKGIGDARIRLIHQENQGVSAARNRGITEARSDLIAFLDADDEWKPAFLDKVVRLVYDFPEAAVFATRYFYCEGRGLVRESWVRGVPSCPWEGIVEDYFGVAARSDPPICSSAVAVKKESLRAVGGFPVGVTSGEDLLTWARLAVRYKIAYSSEPLSTFHFGGNGSPPQPRRQPDDEDIVGVELYQYVMAAAGCQRRSRQCYLALWHRMRASFCLRVGRRNLALKHSMLALTMEPFDWRNHAMFAFALFPSQCGRGLFNCILNVRQDLRRWRQRMIT